MAKTKKLGSGKHWLDPPDWWKKWKPLRWLAVLTIVGGMASGLWSGARLVMEPRAHPETADYTAVSKNGVVLMGAFDSYSSVAAIMAQLSNDGYEAVRKKNHRMPSTEFPPRDLDFVMVAVYKHFDVPGELTLKFFNDRLYEAEFIPNSVEEYAGPLLKSLTGGRRDRISKIELVNGALRVASNVELARSPVGKGLHTSPYAIWQDMRLIRQRDQWDANFGSIPYTAKQ